jgi:lantibiotic modifying enzyme
MGAIDLLVTASQALREEQWLVAAKRRGTALLQQWRAEGVFRCGLPIDAAAPGLMIGLSGIGLGFLRLVAPEVIASPLFLEPPKQHREA